MSKATIKNMKNIRIACAISLAFFLAVSFLYPSYSFALRDLDSGEMTIRTNSSGKISLDLKGVDIVELFKILSKKMGVNIVPTKEVEGRVNIFINDVTFEDALDVILISNSLAAIKDKNIITVMSTEAYAQMFGKQYNETRSVRTLKLNYASPREVAAVLNQLKSGIGKVIVDEPSGTVILIDTPQALLLMEKTIRTLDVPKDTAIIDLKYAKANDIKNKLSGVITPESGEVQVDERTNKIAVSDLPDKMKKIKEVIEAFDEETKQVLIEAQIVQVELSGSSKQLRFGLDWEKIFGERTLRNLDLKGGFLSPGLSNTSALSIGTFPSDKLDTVLQSLNEVAKTNVISRPRIAVLNNEEAEILIGSKEAYFTQTQSQTQSSVTTAESINYMDVGVKLKVTPTITSDNYVIMKIKPEISYVRQMAESPLGSKVPVVETSEAETVVKVKDKAMIMIGGFIRDEADYARKGVPVLRKIPILSWFFSSKKGERNKYELAIFLTPHIISGDIEKLDAEKEQIKEYGVITKKLKGLKE